MKKFLNRYSIFLLSFLAGPAYWYLDAALSARYFDPETTFLQHLKDPTPYQLASRLTIWLLITTLGHLVTGQYGRIRNLRATYTGLLENLPVGAVFQFNPDLIYEMVSGQGLLDAGKEADQLIGRSIREVHRDQTLAVLEPAYREALAGNPSTHTLEAGDRIFQVQIEPIRNSRGEVESGMAVARDISTETALRESDRRFQEILQKVNLAGVILNPDGTINFINNFLLEISGYQREEVIGKSWFQLFIPDEIKTSLEESVFLKAVSSGQVETHHVNPILTKAGDQRLIHWNNIILQTPTGEVRGTASLGSDITETEAYRKNLDNIFQMSSDLICTADLEEFKFKQINPAFEKVLGYPREEILGRPFLEFLHPDDLQPTIEVVEEKLRLGEIVISFTNRYRCQDGSYRWLDWISHPVAEEGMTYAIARDVTEKIAQEQELEQHRLHLEELVAARSQELLISNRELKASERALKTAVADLESFVYSVSHDLRAPLRSINGFADILSRRHRDGLDPEGQEYLDYVFRASQRMGQLIDELLKYSRLGRSAIQLQPVDCQAILGEIESDLQLKIEQTQTEIKVLDHPPDFLSDPTLLKQILLNLIDNAITYQQPGIPPRIQIQCAVRNGSLVFSIEDNGIGIPGEHHEKIFNIFQRLHSEEHYQGTGIGLAIVAKAVSLLGGEIQLESAVGEGSTFTITIPVEEEPEHEA